MDLIAHPLAGERWTGVLEARSTGANGVCCSIKGNDAEVMVHHPLDLNMTYTVYDARVNMFDATQLNVDEKTVIIPAPSRKVPCQDLVEFCAGVGGIGLGAQYAGFQVVMQIDKNHLAVEHLRELQMGEVFQGDISDVQTIKLVHQLLKRNPGAIASGFNCQPFSFQGDQGGFQDPRSSSFHATLYATYLLQPDALVLECTPGAGSHPQVRAGLHALCNVMGWEVQDVTIDLADRWPSMRRRWWAVLTSSSRSPLSLTPWPTSLEHSKLCQIIQEWPVWPKEDEQQLILTERERAAYFEKYPEARFLDMSSKAPTMLHSYGNALDACPCDCRSNGFREERLQAKGLRGFMVRNHDGFVRYIHPREACLLLTFPSDFPLAADLKATLCMLGQSAAPLQGHWIFLHLFVNFFGAVDLDFDKLLLRHCNKLLFDKYHHWPVPSLSLDLEVGLQTSDGAAIRFRKSGVLPVTEVLRALRAECDRWSLMDGCVPVPLGAKLHALGFYGPYLLLRIPKRQMEIQPQNDILLMLSSPSAHMVVQVAAGSFGFQACQLAGFDEPCLLLDQMGQLIWPDQRLWRCQSLWISPLTGRGTSAFAGLHMDFIRHIASMMYTESIMAFKYELVGLHLVSDGFHQHFGSCALLDFPHNKHLILCILLNQHWSLVTIHVLTATTFFASFWDGFDHDIVPGSITTLIQDLEELWQMDCEDINFAGCVPQTLSDSCGAVMLAHLGLVLSLFRREDVGQLETMHSHFQQLCDSHEYLETGSFQLRGQGRPGDKAIQQQLEALLKEKGVPSDRVEERASLGIQKIGIREISEAFQNVNPWGYLKAIGSRPRNSFQWLKSDELQSKIRARATSKFGIQHNKPKGAQKPRKTSAAPLQVDPDQLRLVPGTFFSTNKEMQQLQFTEVVPGASGVAFCSAAEVLPFLRTGKTLGPDPLALLSTTVIPNDQIGSMAAQQLRFPAQFKGTDEPVLIQGTLTQLGDAHIVRGNGKHCDLPKLDTQALKVYVYKDQWDGDWANFVSQPVRSLLAKFPALNLCKATGCGDSCPRFHNAVDEDFDSLILDLWARSWRKADSKFVKPDQADYWSMLIRVPASANYTLQGLSGASGLYIEPRSTCGKRPDDAFGMVWLGELPLEELGHRLKTTANALAIGRLKTRYGLRFAAKHLEQAFQTLKPTETYIAGQVQQLYRLYPVPFGTQRVALQKCITQWGWTAKVRQALGGGEDGSAWEIGATSPPPSSILPGPDGDITVTLLRSMTKPSTPAPLLVSSNTKKFLQQTKAPSSSSASSDPWLHGPDPWGGYNKSASTVSAALSSDKIKQLDDKWSSRIKEAVQQELASSTPATEVTMTPVVPDDFVAETNARFQRLETGLTELQAQSGKYEQWFTQMHQTDQQLAAQIDLQGHKIEQVSKDLESKTNSLKDGLDRVENEISRGFSQMEALLEKKNKTSWLGRSGLFPRGPGLSFKGVWLTCLWVLASSASAIQLPHGSLMNQSDQADLSQRAFCGFDQNSGDAFARFLEHSAVFQTCDFGSGLARTDDSDTWGIDETQGQRSQPCSSTSHSEVLVGPECLCDLNLSAETHLAYFPFGEALNPGPRIAIHVANPTGLAHKEEHIYSLVPGIVNISETHLASPGLTLTCRKFRSWAHRDHRRLSVLPGAAVPLRARSQSTGIWSGVMQLSDLPCHALQLPWPNNEFKLGRVQSSCFRLDNLQIIGVNLYGWSPGPTWPRAHAATRDLLRHLTQEIIWGSSGLRFIAGDFNGSEDTFPEWLEWHQAGWREVQTLHWENTGDGPHATCKGSSRPDRLWVSPELAAYFVAAEVKDLFADHSVLSGFFEIPCAASHYQWWPMPAKIPWHCVDLQAWHQSDPQFLAFSAGSGSSSDYFAALGKHYEDHLAQHCKSEAFSGLPPACRGRGQHFMPTKRLQQLGCPKPSRSGEEQPRSSFMNRSVQKWFSQLRRLQSLIHNLRRASDTASAAAPLNIKFYLLRQAFWSKAFHAIGISLLPFRHVASLRTQAVKALGFGHAGAHPGLRLGLLTDNMQSDPGFFQIHRAIFDFRRFAGKCRDTVTMWQDFMVAFDGKRLSGPFSKLLELFEQVAWTIATPPWFIDHDGCYVDLIGCSSSLLEALLADAWRQRLAREVSGRKDFQGLEGLMWPPSRKESRLSSLDVSRINALREGVFLSGSTQGRYDLVKGFNCHLCGEVDSISHRCCDCPALAHVRAAHEPALQLWPVRPISMTEHLLPSRAAWTVTRKRELAALADCSQHTFTLPDSGCEWTDFFTDGSCWFPDRPDFSLAAWAVTTTDPMSTCLAGPLAGQQQDVRRAELTAALVVLRWCVHSQRRAALWTDSSYTASGLH